MIQILMFSIAILIVGISWRFMRSQGENLPNFEFSDEIWSMVITFLIVCGVCIFVVNAVSLKDLPRTVDSFVGSTTGEPITETFRGEREIFGMLVAVAFIIAVTRLGDRARRFASQLALILKLKWKALGNGRLAILIFAMFITGWLNISTITSMHFAYNEHYWDLEAEVFVGKQSTVLKHAIKGLQQNGCILCTKDLQPIENISKGGDIGLIFIFELLTKMGLPATLEGYQVFIAYSVTSIFLLGSIIITVGYRSEIAGITFLFFFMTISTLTDYESILITSYWVPGGAAILSGTLALAIQARLTRDRKISNKLSTWFFYIGFGLWGFVGGLALLGRSSAGYITLSSAIFVWLIVLFIKRDYRRSFITFGFLVSTFIIPLVVFQFALNWRIEHYNLQEPAFGTSTSHPFSLAVYVGLGYVQNDWGIRYSDRFGQLQCPDTVYLGDEFYDCIGRSVSKILLNDPNLFFRNFIAKSEAIIQFNFTHLSIGLWLPAFIILIRRRIEFFILGVLLFLNSIPSLLTVPYYRHLQGYAQIIVIFVSALIINFIFELSDDIGHTGQHQVGK